MKKPVYSVASMISIAALVWSTGCAPSSIKMYDGPALAEANLSVLELYCDGCVIRPAIIAINGHPVPAEKKLWVAFELKPGRQSVTVDIGKLLLAQGFKPDRAAIGPAETNATLEFEAEAGHRYRFGEFPASAFAWGNVWYFLSVMSINVIDVTKGVPLTQKIGSFAKLSLPGEFAGLQQGNAICLYGGELLGPDKTALLRFGKGLKLMKITGATQDGQGIVYGSTSNQASRSMFDTIMATMNTEYSLKPGKYIVTARYFQRVGVAGSPASTELIAEAGRTYEASPKLGTTSWALAIR